jgi:hypothetical protein
MNFRQRVSPSRPSAGNRLLVEPGEPSGSVIEILEDPIRSPQAIAATLPIGQPCPQWVLILSIPVRVVHDTFAGELSFDDS